MFRINRLQIGLTIIEILIDSQAAEVKKSTKILKIQNYLHQKLVLRTILRKDIKKVYLMSLLTTKYIKKNRDY